MNRSEIPLPESAGSFACVAAAWGLHEAELRGYLRRRLGGADSAEDVLQEVFLRALRQGRGFCALDNPRAWLFQVARHALVDHVRTAKAGSALADGESERLAEPAERSPPEPAPVEALAHCIERVLTELAANDAAVLRACDLGGETRKAFAEANGLGLPAVKARLLRARRRLRERLTLACQVRFDGDGHVAGHVPRPDRDD